MHDRADHKRITRRSPASESKWQSRRRVRQKRHLIPVEISNRLFVKLGAGVKNDRSDDRPYTKREWAALVGEQVALMLEPPPKK